MKKTPVYLFLVIILVLSVASCQMPTPASLAALIQDQDSSADPPQQPDQGLHLYRLNPLMKP